MTTPAPGVRGLCEADWQEVKHFSKDETIQACQDGRWQQIDAGSFYLLDQFAGHLVQGRRLIEAVQFMPTKTSSGISTATWNLPSSDAHERNSWHYRGRAFDLMFPRTKLATAWLTAVRFPKWGGIGAYPFWRPDPGLHLDSRGVGDLEQGVGFRVLWWVTRAGQYQYLNSEEDIYTFLGVLRETG